jgi:hypothetical protein
LDNWGSVAGQAAPATTAKHCLIVDDALLLLLLLLSPPMSSQLDPAVLLPLLFKLFRVNDKQLRELLFRHIISGQQQQQQHLNL